MNIQFAKTTRMKNEFETLSIINQDLLEDMDRQKDTIRMLEATITYLEEKFDQIKKNTAADEASFIQTFSATEEDKAGLGELMNLTEEEEEDAGEEEEEEEVYCLGRFNPEEIIDGEFNLTSFSPVAVAAEPVDTIEETIIPSTIGATNVLVDAIHTTASIQLQEKPCAMEQMKIEKQFLMNLGMVRKNL